jgi:cytochrome c oxidase subunit 3
MPITSERVATERKPKLGGGGPGKIPHRRGYGGGDDGDRDRPEGFQSSQQRLRRGRIAVGIGMVCIATLFIALTVVYLARQQTHHWDPDQRQEVYEWKPLTLPYQLLWLNSTVLLFSSVALELARRSMFSKVEFSTMGILPPRGSKDPPWLALTVGLGLGFLAGQILVWNNLHSQGMFLRANPSSSFFYLLTGLHAAHLTGGLAVLLYAACGRWLRTKFESQRVTVELAAWYWHFMGLLWLGIFALLHFGRS